MDHGKAIAVGTPNELKAMIQNKETVQVEIPKLDEEQRGILASLPHVYDDSYEDSILKLCFDGGNANLIHVLNCLQENHVKYGRIYSELPTLNDVFLEITGKELRD